MSYTIDRVVTDTMEMAYSRFGHGARPLVILPGLSVQRILPSASAIENRYQIFKKDFTVYVFERRENLPPVYTVEDMAADTAAAMTALSLRDCGVFGASQGGMMALVLAVRYPELVSRLALGSSAAKVDEGSTAVLAEWLRFAKEKNTENLYLSFGEKVYPPAVFRQYEKALKRLACTVTEEELERFVTLAAGAADFDVTSRLAQIQCPVLAIGDTDDRVLGTDATLAIAEQLKDKPDFTLYLYEGYGHAAYDTAPDYPQRLYDFFTA